MAYCGALKAVEEQGCWFEAVAGSSAGAITAALIAAGYSWRELEKPLEQLLELIRFPGFWKSIWRLRTNSEILPREAFRRKLDDLLRTKAGLFGVKLGEELTFEDLHNFTGVDLYVVAADISRQRPMVFHHRYTPRCQVADAIMASSSIPFVFDGGMLTSDGSKLVPDTAPRRTIDRRAFRTVVDGGVWTNFPMFVFKDSAFQEYMSRLTDEAPVLQRGGPVIGFMLHELLDDAGGDVDETARQGMAKADYRGAHFEDGTPRGYQIGPIEQTFAASSPGKALDDNVPPAVRSGLRWLDGPDARRWPTPKLYRNYLTLIDQILLPATTWFAVIFPVAFLLWGTMAVDCVQPAHMGMGLVPIWPDERRV